MQEKVKIANRYHILEYIGRGSLSAVYKAQDELLERIVAIKQVDTSLFNTETSESEYTNRFLNEARMMAKVHHPNIMPIYDLVEDQDALYIVMPLVRGNWDELENKIHESPLMEGFRLLERIAHALDFLHQHQIIHRDLKPRNIFVSNDNQPYIADFGLAQLHQIKDGITASGMVIGTLSYMAPELLRGEELTPSADIFSFGMLVYNILTGQYPFDTSDMSQLLMQIVESPLPSLAPHRPELSQALIQDIDRVIARLTSKSPKERYPTATEAVEELYRILYNAEQTIKGRVFISYSRQDEAFVHQLADELQRYHVDLWIDRNIEYGSDWSNSIDDQLKGCDVMLVVATPDSMESFYVTYEWSYFIGANKPIFPFVPEPTDKLVLHPRLQRMQYIKGTEDMVHNVRQIIAVTSQAVERRNKQSS